MKLSIQECLDLIEAAECEIYRHTEPYHEHYRARLQNLIAKLQEEEREASK